MGLKQRVIHDNSDQQIVVKTGIFTLTDRHDVIVVNATAPIEIVLPNATGIEGKNYVISRVDSTAHNVMVRAVDFQKINGADNYYINAQWSVITFSATDLSPNSSPVPGYFIKNVGPTAVVKEDFTSLLDFNRDKVVYQTANSNITYSASTRPKKYGVVIQHRIQSTSSANVSFPAGWNIYGEFKPNQVNWLTFVAVPDSAVETDMVQVTIRN